MFKFFSPLVKKGKNHRQKWRIDYLKIRNDVLASKMLWAAKAKEFAIDHYAKASTQRFAFLHANKVNK